MLLRQAEQQEFKRAYVAHQISDRRQPGRLRAGVVAEFAMHGGQRRKDRSELARHAARAGAGGSEEEFGALARIADATQQIFEAVHGAQGMRRSAGNLVTGALPGCD